MDDVLWLPGHNERYSVFWENDFGFKAEALMIIPNFQQLEVSQVTNM